MVDQLPSMVSLVWALKGRNISTWLCTVLHCSGYTVSYCFAEGFMLNLKGATAYAFGLLLSAFLLDVSRGCDFEMKYLEAFIDGHCCLCGVECYY